jgi:Putative zinc-finger
VADPEDLDDLWERAPERSRRRRVTGSETDRLHRIRRGDQRAADVLLDRHLAASWHLALVMVGDEHSAAAAVLEGWRDTVGDRDATDFRLALLGHVHDRSLVPPLLARAASWRVDHTGVLDGFRELSDEQQTAWWLKTVEALPEATVAQVLGRGPVVTREALLDIELVMRNATLEHQRWAATDECERAVSRFDGYLDGTLEARDVRLLNVHLEVCEACTARLDALEDPAHALLELVPPPPAGVRADVRALVIAEAR